jgi:hypothetical protein
MLHLDRLFILFVFCCFGIGSTKGQVCALTFTGFVQDEFARLDSAQVYIEEMQMQVVCDRDGMFKLGRLCRGGIHFFVSQIGYESKRFFVDIQGDTSTLYKRWLAKISRRLQS